ncbi:MAG TPA: DUF4397 domain-containing protein [Anaerolineae bacterium]|nr:DUF4397 domain-containing protein [Anaerolineae bacterium]HPL30005.1 DUF4397 domain-containing protein [Anaerolineae bacterium]
MKRWFLILTALALLLPAGSSLAQGNLARLRLVQASPSAPPLDAAVNGNTIFGSLQFKGITPYALLTPGASNVQLAPADGGQPALLNLDANLAACTDYTLLALGPPESIEPLLLLDDNSPPAPGQARVRLVNASPNAPAVDVAVAGGPVLFSSVPFKGAAGYASVSVGTYTLEVREVGSGRVLLTVPDVTFDNCTVYTLFAVGLLDGDPPLEVVSAVDAVTGCAPPAATPVTSAAATPTPVSVCPSCPAPLITPQPIVRVTPATVCPSCPPATATSAASATPIVVTPVSTAVATATPPPAPSATPVVKIVTPVSTAVPTAAPSAAPSATPVVKIVTPVSTAVPTAAPSAAPSATPVVKVVTPTVTRAKTAAPSATPTSSAVVRTSTPAATATGVLTSTVTPKATGTMTATQAVTATKAKTASPTAMPTTAAPKSPTGGASAPKATPVALAPAGEVVWMRRAR